MKRAWIVCALFLISRSAYADDERRAEARASFDRGLQLFNANDNAGALAEFKLAFDLIPNPVVLYNIGLVYAAMNRSVEAVAALDAVLRDPGPVSGARLARAKRTRDEHARRIAVLTVKTSVPSSIELDNVEVGRTTGAPLVLKLTGGTHVVGAIAAGHAPLRKEVTIAGQEERAVDFDLVPIEGTVAHLTLRTTLPAADVFVDGTRVGQTPLAQSLSLTPGQHAVEVRRDGYITAHEDLTLGDGAVANVSLEPAEDRAATARDGGTMALDLSEAEVVVTVDGQTRGVYLAPIRLPRGSHRLLLERGGFMPMDRDVTIDSARTTLVHAQLEPTPETRIEITSKAERVRAIAWVGIVAGAAIAVGSGIYVGVNASSRSDAERDFDAKNGALANKTGECNIATGGNAEQCNADAEAAQKRLSDANTRQTAGVVGIAAGAAILAGGLVLYFVGDDPHKYDRAPEIAVRPWLAPGVAGTSLGWRF